MPVGGSSRIVRDTEPSGDRRLPIRGCSSKLCVFWITAERTLGPIAEEKMYQMKPLTCDPKAIKGMSERLIVSHYENNYGGTVQRLNAITAQLAELDFATAPIFIINGLKREELIATNSMILHELFFASLGEASAPEGEFRGVLARDFGSFDRWRA